MTNYVITNVEIGGQEVERVSQNQRAIKSTDESLELGSLCTVKRGNAPSEEDGTIVVTLRLRRI